MNHNNEIIGSILLIFGGILLLVFARQMIIYLVIAFLGIIFINYGLDFLGFEITILSNFQDFVFKNLKLKIKPKTKWIDFNIFKTVD